MTGAPQPDADILRAPWNALEIALLSHHQRDPHRHPYRCGNDSTHRVLVATAAGWRCEECDYAQDWAHSFSAGRESTDGGADALRDTAGAVGTSAAASR